VKTSNTLDSSNKKCNKNSHFHRLVHITQPNILKMNHDKRYSTTSILRMIDGNTCTQCKRMQYWACQMRLLSW